MGRLVRGERAASESVIAQADEALEAHELVKVRAIGMVREARDEALELLVKRTKSEMVGRIGHMVLPYRRNVERTRVVLPQS